MSKKGHKHKQQYNGARPFKFNEEDILHRADFEIERLKKVLDVSYKSQYKKYNVASRGNYNNVDFQSKCGYKFAYFSDPDWVGSFSDWNEAFERFAKKTTNIYGKKVDRSELLRENSNYNQSKYI